MWFIYLQVVAPLPVKWLLSKMLLPVCECPCCRGDEGESLLVFFCQ